MAARSIADDRLRPMQYTRRIRVGARADREIWVLVRLIVSQNAVDDRDSACAFL